MHIAAAVSGRKAAGRPTALRALVKASSFIARPSPPGAQRKNSSDEWVIDLISLSDLALLFALRRNSFDSSTVFKKRPDQHFLQTSVDQNSSFSAFPQCNFPSSPIRPSHLSAATSQSTFIQLILHR